MLRTRKYYTHNTYHCYWYADYALLEQLAGQPSFNSDIYALGIVSIQALTGIPPNQLKRDPQTGAVVWRHQAQVREELAEIIDKMTHYMYTEC